MERGRVRATEAVLKEEEVRRARGDRCGRLFLLRKGRFFFSQRNTDEFPEKRRTIIEACQVHNQTKKQYLWCKKFCKLL